jgi:hypothetical protein
VPLAKALSYYVHLVTSQGESLRETMIKMLIEAAKLRKEFASEPLANPCYRACKMPIMPLESSARDGTITLVLQFSGTIFTQSPISCQAIDTLPSVG